MTKKQKKFYLSPKAAWYLEMMQTVTGNSQGDIIEGLINEQAASKGLDKLPVPSVFPDVKRQTKADERRLEQIEDQIQTIQAQLDLIHHPKFQRAAISMTVKLDGTPETSGRLPVHPSYLSDMLKEQVQMLETEREMLVSLSVQ